MNLNELLNSTITEKVDAKKYLYHVTFTKNVPNIKKKGLIQFQPSNWIKGPGGDRYNNDIAGIFAFDHPKDALNWAGKMEYEFRDTDKNISIVRIDMEDFWEDDPAEDPFVSNKGKAKYSPRDIKADKIIDVLDMSGIKRPGDLGISRDEWLADVSKKLEEVGRPKKIDALDYDIDSTTDIDNIANNDDISVSAEQKELVSMILANTSLKPRYKKVIFKRFWKGETLEKVADSFGVTRERIRQMELKALRMMRYQARKLGVIEFEKLTELHGGGGIPDYTTMPAYGLKRAKKGKHKFFVPKGEKLPAGVGAIKEEMAGEERYHDYTIKYILAPNAQGIYRGIIHPPKNLKDTLEAKRLEATSIDELIHSAKEWIESGFSPSRSWSEVPTDASITLDLNSSFMLDSLGVNAVHYIKLSQINGRPVLLVAPDDAIENYGSNEVEKKQGYKKTATKSPGTSSSFMSKAKAKEIGLKPNGRYTLEKSNKKTDNMGSDIYSMVFNSIVSPTKEQKRLSVPAVTIAVNRSTKRSVPLEGLTEADKPSYHRISKKITGNPTYYFQTGRGSKYAMVDSPRPQTMRDRSGKNHNDPSTGLQQQSFITVFLDEKTHEWMDQFLSKGGGKYGEYIIFPYGKFGEPYSKTAKGGIFLQGPDKVYPLQDVSKHYPSMMAAMSRQDVIIRSNGKLITVPKNTIIVHGNYRFPYTVTPKVGLSPAELYNTKDQWAHFGNKITEVLTSLPDDLTEEATQKYYHGSYDKLENGTILTPGGDDYEASWGGTSFYGPLEKFRPPEKLAHKEGVFMVGDIDDVDVAGGATEYIYIVEPIGDVQKHDLNWGSEISGLMDNGKKPNDKEVKQAADNYWNGVPHHNEQVWEYLAPRAKIVSVLDEAWKVKVPTKKKRKMSKQDKDWSMLRTALESDLFEAGTGDCFEVANRAMIGMTEEQEVYGMKCIHAYVYGQGDLKGRRFPHAWNEQGDVVFDNSNGNNIVMRKEQYYALGGVVQESGAYVTYDKDDCLIKMLKHSHYGPWDLNDSLDENIPDEAKEIGKETSRIPRNLLNTIKNELDLEAQVESAWEEFKSNVE